MDVPEHQRQHQPKLPKYNQTGRRISGLGRTEADHKHAPQRLQTRRRVPIPQRLGMRLLQSRQRESIDLDKKETGPGGRSPRRYEGRQPRAPGRSPGGEEGRTEAQTTYTERSLARVQERKRHTRLHQVYQRGDKSRPHAGLLLPSRNVVGDSRTSTTRRIYPDSPRASREDVQGRTRQGRTSNIQT